MSAATQRKRIEQAIKERVWAVVGASNNQRKFGNIIYRDLRAAGYTVYPVNPNCTTVEGDRAYPSLLELPERVAVANIVVPAHIGLRIADDAVAAGIGTFWLQPGAASDELIAHAAALGLSVIHHACAMVEKRHRPDST